MITSAKRNMHTHSDFQLCLQVLRHYILKRAVNLFVGDPHDHIRIFLFHV